MCTVFFHKRHQSEGFLKSQLQHEHNKRNDLQRRRLVHSLLRVPRQGRLQDVDPCPIVDHDRGDGGASLPHHLVRKVRSGPQENLDQQNSFGNLLERNHRRANCLLFRHHRVLVRPVAEKHVSALWVFENAHRFKHYDVPKRHCDLKVHFHLLVEESWCGPG